MRSCDSRALTVCILVAALSGCRSTPPPAVTMDADLSRLAAAARRVFDMGETDRAIPLYREALARARALDDAAAVGVMAANLSACLLDVDDPDAALQAVREARASLRRAGRSDLEAAVLEARIELARGDPDVAARIAEAWRGARPVAARDSLAAAALVDASIALALSDVEDAGAAIAAAGQLVASSSAPSLRAWHAEIVGRFELVAGRPAASAAAFEAAAKLRGAVSQSRRVVENLLTAATAYEAGGGTTEAADCLYRAGRALIGLGQPAEAGPVLARAADLARGSGDAGGLPARIESLQAELASQP